MNEDKLLEDVQSHYAQWTEDNQIRQFREFGWNDITDAYYGILPQDWPFLSRVVDPRIKTALQEKNARLSNGRLKGRFVPRESGDVIGARINNALIDFQWDTANDGGSMQTKISICDLDTRLYASKFGLVKWRHEVDEDGNIVFSGNEFYPLDIRNCGMDFAALHIKNAKWFQERSFMYTEDLEKVSDIDGKPMFKNVDLIRKALENKTSIRRDTKVTSRVLTLRGLTDRVGTDKAFPTIEVVTEYRKDIWITFSPEYNVILRVIKNPYKHGRIPIAQLRYHPLQDDALGESEVESVIPLWKAIQATVCGFMDEVILKMRPPLKIDPTRAQIETIQYAPEAQWLMDDPSAVMEMQSAGEAIRYFQSSYSSLVSAFNTAMNMMSQGTSAVDPFNPQKTATEVRASVSQQNAMDQKNQTDLIEFIKDIIIMWQSNNKQFLFQDEKKQQYVLRIVGGELFEYFKRMGLNDYELPNESAQLIADMMQQYPDMTPEQLQTMVDAGSMPMYPIVDNPNEKDPNKLQIKPKFQLDKTGTSGSLTIVPEDLDGQYDYIADVKSMALGADTEMMNSRQQAIDMIVGNPQVIQLLNQEGYNVKVKELLVTNFEDKGLRDAERYFEKANANQPTQSATNQVASPSQFSQNGPVPTVPQTNITGGTNQQMAGPSPVSNNGPVYQSVQ